MEHPTFEVTGLNIIGDIVLKLDCMHDPFRKTVNRSRRTFNMDMVMLTDLPGMLRQSNVHKR